MKKSTNPCTRCGKERVFLREWVETVPSFLGDEVKVIHRENVCPDSECQKIVQAELDKQKKKRDELARNKDERLKNRKSNFALARKKKTLN